MDGECLFEMEGNKLGKEHKQESWVSVCIFGKDKTLIGEVLFTFIMM